MGPPAVDDRLDSPVLLFAGVGGIVRDRPGQAVSLGRQAGPVDAEFLHKIIDYALGPPLGEPQVILGAGHIVGMSFNHRGGGGIFLHEYGYPADFVAVFIPDD